MSAEKRLTQEMTNRYRDIGIGGRPVVNTNTTTNVRFGLGLIQMELDEREKILASSMWVIMVSVNCTTALCMGRNIIIILGERITT
jgi:hypothetical protein